MRYFLLLPLLSAFPVLAESDRPFSVSVGFLTGSPLNDPASRTSVFTSYAQSRWTGGSRAELHLTGGFSIEFDGLYRTYRSNSTLPLLLSPNTPPINTYRTTSTNVWDLPLLLKKRFAIGVFHPFLSAGYQWSYERSSTSYLSICSAPEATCVTPSYPFQQGAGTAHSSDFVTGPVAAAGLEFQARHVRISPELRFTRPTNGFPRDNRLTALVGFSWEKK